MHPIAWFVLVEAAVVSFDDEKVFEHESYGLIAINRVSGGGRSTLFGSSLEWHPTLMQVTIRKAKRYHSLAHDRYYGSEEIIRLVLTPAQFAEMVSNPNVGFGVPCTLQHIGGKRLEDPPKTTTEAHEVREKFKLDTEALVQKGLAGTKEKKR